MIHPPLIVSSGSESTIHRGMKTVKNPSVSFVTRFVTSGQKAKSGSFPSVFPPAATLMITCGNGKNERKKAAFAMGTGTLKKGRFCGNI